MARLRCQCSRYACRHRTIFWTTRVGFAENMSNYRNYGNYVKVGASMCRLHQHHQHWDGRRLWCFKMILWTSMNTIAGYCWCAAVMDASSWQSHERLSRLSPSAVPGLLTCHASSFSLSLRKFGANLKTTLQPCNCSCLLLSGPKIPKQWLKVKLGQMLRDAIRINKTHKFV